MVRFFFSFFFEHWEQFSLSFSRHFGRRCSRLGVRWYLMWRGLVCFPDILSWVHCCTVLILHHSQSRSHQMALKSGKERERDESERENKASEGWREEAMEKRRCWKEIISWAWKRVKVKVATGGVSWMQADVRGNGWRRKEKRWEESQPRCYRTPQTPCWNQQ